ncbi:dethiobiotin synthase [Thiosulfativibrio zosterae]|uniref:ATP-dependent dethiobiotin synthetase BioD n=1 Tax=Thiosulfativibrio zosterae TaxID=2675053 RepID=A0A6F8PKS7_9GAMM|nr:dethiobiotin synthase [Thiosulfativibrio zosterae]BBP42678.1 ATP-dependent dethiobiotin synthetase BioD [Thiosulfativibrio zosterae]
MPPPFDALKALLETTECGGFFITGTDTDSGKTYVTCQIAEFLRQNCPGLVIFGRKPIASGAILLADGTLRSEDAFLIQQACGAHESLEMVCPYVFEPPISPARAIAQSEQNILLPDLLKACEADGFRLVEGAGGFYSPLTPDGLNADLAKALGLPLILVVGNRLGCINQALLSITAIENSGLQIAAVLVNQITPDADTDNYQDLQALLKHKPYPCELIPFKAH